MTLPNLADSTEMVQLLRLSCRELRRVPIGATLKETLDLAASPEALAMRNKLGEWVELASESHMEPAVLALEAAAGARKHLETGRTMARTGELATWIGVPVAFAGAFVAGPVIAAAGIVVAVGGAVAVAGDKTIKRFNRWAMYGAA